MGGHFVVLYLITTNMSSGASVSRPCCVLFMSHINLLVRFSTIFNTTVENKHDEKSRFATQNPSSCYNDHNNAQYNTVFVSISHFSVNGSGVSHMDDIVSNHN
jgi:hypothetical protein